MDLAAVKNFSSTLQGISHGHEYIKKSHGKFVRVQTKDQKNLNTTEIAKVGQQALNALHRVQTVSYLQQSKLYREFALGIEEYLVRLDQHKNIFQKIGWWFGLADEAEYQLYEEFKASKRLAQKFHDDDASIRHNISEISKQLDRRKTTLDELKILYASILDSAAFRIPELEGLSVSLVAKWMIEQLKAFMLQVSGQKQLLEKILAEMQQHLEIAIVQNQLANGRQAELKEWVVREILGTIHALEVGDEFVMPGGYRVDKADKQTGHGVEYVICRESGSTYSFTIVNTGEGVEYYAPVIDSVNMLLGTILYGNQAKEKPRVVDVSWKKVLSQALNEEFVKLILEPTISKQSTDMEEIQSAISAHFKKSQATRGRGRVHKAQKKGTCAVKSITSWLHEKMGDVLWREFKLFYTRREVKKLDRLLPLHIDVASQRIFREGVAQVLNRRQTKVT